MTNTCLRENQTQKLDGKSALYDHLWLQSAEFSPPVQNWSALCQRTCVGRVRFE